MYDLLEKIQQFEVEVNAYKESLNKKPEPLPTPKSQEKNLIKIKSHNPLNSKSPNKINPANKNLKVVNNKSSLNLGKVTLTESIFPSKNEEKKKNFKENDSKGTIEKKSSPSRNEKNSKLANLKKPLTPARIGNKKLIINEQTKRNNKNDQRTTIFNENTNVNTSQESIYNTNKSCVIRPSSSVGNKMSSSDKKTKPLKLNTPKKKINLNQSMASLRKEKLEDKQESSKRKLNRSIQTDENSMKQTDIPVPCKTALPLETSINEKKNLNLLIDNNQHINIKLNQTVNEINDKKDNSIQLDKIDKIELNPNEYNGGNLSVDSKRIDIDFHQLGSGKIEDFVIENANIEANLLNTVSHISDLAFTREIPQNDNISMQNINMKSDTYKTNN